MPATVYVGIDVHSRQHVAAVVPLSTMELPGAAWKKKAATLKLLNRRPDFAALLAAIRSHEPDPQAVQVAVDHTGGHYSAPLVHFLLTEGFDVYHLEPKAVHMVRKGILDEERKDDSLDAATLARLLYLRDRLGESLRIAPVRPDLTSSATGIRAAILQRWSANKTATQAANRLHQYLTATFPEGEKAFFKELLTIARFFPPTPDRILAVHAEGNPDALPLPRKKWSTIVEAARESVGVPSAPFDRVLSRAGEDYARAIAQRDAMGADIEAHVQAHPYGPILLSFPYVGPAAAAVVIATIQDVSRYPTKKHFRKALGLYSTAKQSGERAPEGKMGREGSRDGRRVLYQACMGMVAKSAPPTDFRDTYQRQVDNGKKRKRALVAIAGKLAEVIYHCLRTGQPYRYQGTWRKEEVA
jgi:transposase